MRQLGIGFLILAAVTTSAAAQTCGPTDSIETCWDKFTKPAEVKAQAQTQTQQNVATANTGPITIGTPNESSLKDFLSLFAASVDNASVSEKGNAVTLDWNVPVPAFGPDRTIKLQGVFTKPVVSDDVKKALESNATAATTLNDGLTNVDDIQASATYSPVDHRLGRSMGPHVALLDTIVQMALKPAKVFDPVRHRIEEAHQELKGDTPFSVITDTTEQAKVIAVIQQSAQAQAQAVQTAVPLVKTFTRLINNQPQIYGSVLYRARKDFVGPNALSAKFSYERGTENMNRFLDGPGADCAPDKRGNVANPTACFNAFQQYASRTQSLPESMDRLSVSLEYARQDARKVDLSAFGVADPLVAPQGHSVVFSATYGHQLVTRPDRRDGRLDVALNYEDNRGIATPDGSAPVKDRFVGSVTFTQKLTDTLTMPLSLIYANHSQFLSNVDRKLNVHFGIAYKLPKIGS